MYSLPVAEALNATLVVDRVAERLCVVDHRSYDHRDLSLWRTRPAVIDHLRSISIGKPVSLRCRRCGETLAEVIEVDPAAGAQNEKSDDAVLNRKNCRRPV